MCSVVAEHTCKAVPCGSWNVSIRSRLRGRLTDEQRYRCTVNRTSGQRAARCHIGCTRPTLQRMQISIAAEHSVLLTFSMLQEVDFSEWIPLLAR